MIVSARCYYPEILAEKHFQRETVQKLHQIPVFCHWSETQHVVLLRPTNHRTRTKQCGLQPLTDPAVLVNISGAMLIRFCKQIIVNTHCCFSRFHPTKGLFKNHKYFHDVLLVEQNFNPCEQTKLGVSLLIAGK